MAGLYNKSTGLVKERTPDAGVANFDGEVANITSYDIIDENGLCIGFITQINETDNRPATKVRHIGSADAGRVLEHVPGVDDKTLNVTGFALYNVQEQGSIVQRLGGNNTKRAMKMLSEQHRGFKIVERQIDPETEATLDATEHLDCWLTNYTKPRNIANATIAETATLSVAGSVRPLNFANI